MASDVAVAAFFVYLNDAVNAPISTEAIVRWIVTFNLVLLVIRIRIVVLPSAIKLKEAYTRAVAGFGISAAFVSNDVNNLILTRLRVNLVTLKLAADFRAPFLTYIRVSA